MKLKIFFLFIALFCGSPFCLHAERSNSKATEYKEQGLALYEGSKYNEAMNAFIRGLEQAEREGDTRTAIICTGYISNIYNKLGDIDRCIYYQQKGYRQALEANDSILQLSMLSNMVASYCKKGEIAKAREAFEKEKSLVACDSLHGFYYLIYNRARIAKAEGNYDEALRQHRAAIMLAQEKQMKPSFLLYQYVEIADIELLQDNYVQAERDARRCLTLATQLGDMEMVAYTYELLSETCAQLGDTVQATNWRHRYLFLSDSLFSMDKFYTASSELMDYENKQTHQHIGQLNKQIARQWFTIVAISLVLLLLIMLTIYIERNNRKLLHAHQMLVSKNREISEKEAQNRQLKAQLAPHTELHDRIVEALDDTNIIFNPELTLTQLAETVGSNVKYVSQIVNDTYGKPFKTLLNERRVQEACKRLSDAEHYGHMTIQAIYEEVGYRNAVSFIRAFKKVNGMTPSEYQQALKK